MATSPKFRWKDCEHAILTETTAMACWSWSLPAGTTCPGMVARDASDICYGCYAMTGCYNYSTTMNAQAARFAWLRECMRTQEGRELWVSTMASAINRCATNGYFRWHDSGDIFSAEYCRMIADVCRRTTKVKHWLPTRSWRLPWVDAIRELQTLPNVVVRPSALQFNETAPKIDGLGKGTTAHLQAGAVPRGHRECPKASSENASKSCEQAGCRKCWQNVSCVSFYVHGRMGKHVVHHSTANERSARAAVLKSKLAYVPLQILETV